MVKKKLSFSLCDEGVTIAPDISKFRELKLRLLNGTHTLSCGLAVLAGFQIVKDAMQNFYFKNFVTHLMLDEIAICVVSDQITYDEAKEFGYKVIDRFLNPFIEHHWLSITLQYTSKMQMRNVPILQKHYRLSNKVPQHIALGFAGYILFMRSKKTTANKFVGNNGVSEYIINDDKAEILHAKWDDQNISGTVQNILSDKNLWNADLTLFPGFADVVTKNVELMIINGAEETIKKLSGKIINN